MTVGGMGFIPERLLMMMMMMILDKKPSAIEKDILIRSIYVYTSIYTFLYNPNDQTLLLLPLLGGD